MNYDEDAAVCSGCGAIITRDTIHDHDHGKGRRR